VEWIARPVQQLATGWNVRNSNTGGSEIFPTGHVARTGEGRGVYRVLVGKPEGRRRLGRPRRRWDDNIRMDLREVERGFVDWMELAQDKDSWRALVSDLMNLRVP
jgi:hypothetical protein